MDNKKLEEIYKENIKSYNYLSQEIRNKEIELHRIEGAIILLKSILNDDNIETENTENK